MPKKVLAIPIVMFKFILSASAQVSETGIKPDWANLDYAVPESPAFKILGTDPDNILKPTSVRKVALSVGNYFFTNGSVLPKNFSAEVSPLLLNNKANLFDYNKNKFGYRMRLSLGTSTSTNNSYAVAEGLRFTLVDKSDLRINKAFLKDVFGTLKVSVAAEDRARDEFKKQYHLTAAQFAERFDSDSSFQAKVLAFETQFIPDNVVRPDSLADLRNKYREVLWNAPIWEVGIATLQSSKDSLIKNLTFSQIGLWSSAGFPMGKKGQVLIGGKIGFIDSTGWQTNASAGFRVYYGSNNVRGYLLGEYDYKNKLNGAVTGLGCQFNLLNGLWGQFSFNLVIDENNKVSYKPSFNIYFGTPEKKE